MCQGVIASLVKFRVGKKRKSVILSGIGSHSDLFGDNREKLIGLSGVEGEGEEIVSIESDFSGWNKFTVESGEPSKSDYRKLAAEYKRIAGSSKALIAHVLRCMKIDEALLSLLTAPARAEYNKVTASAWAALFRKKSNRVERLR